MSDQLDSKQSRAPARRAASISFHFRDQSNGQESWDDEIKVTRTRRGVFTVYARKHLASRVPPHRWICDTLERWPSIREPEQLGSALSECAEYLGVELDWSEVIDRLARIDWLSALLLAANHDLDLPRFPGIAVVRTQRSLRALGKVEVVAEWGYEQHSVTMGLDAWLRILSGEAYSVSEPYWYEGEKFLGTWNFGPGQKLLVESGDDGGEAWVGDLNGLPAIYGPVIWGVDVARLALKACAATLEVLPVGVG